MDKEPISKEAYASLWLQSERTVVDKLTKSFLEATIVALGEEEAKTGTKIVPAQKNKILQDVATEANELYKKIRGSAPKQE